MAGRSRKRDPGASAAIKNLAFTVHETEDHTMQNPALWFQTKFAPNVTHRFNETGYALKQATTGGEHLGADAYRFYLQANGEAQLRGGSGKYSFQSTAQSSVDIKALTYDFAVKVRQDDIRRMSVNAVDAQAKAAANGCAMRANRIVLETLQNAAIGTGNVVGAFANDFKISDAVRVKEIMDENGVPDDGGRFCAIRANWWNIMSLAEIFSSSDYTGPAMPLMGNGMMRTWNGIHWLCFPNKLMPTTGAPVGVTKPGVNVEGLGFAWHRDAVGSGTINNGELRTEMNKMSDEPVHTLVTEFDMASAALQLEGIVHIRAKSVSAYPTATTAL
jgi:hypothetical protein